MFLALAVFAAVLAGCSGSGSSSSAPRGAASAVQFVVEPNSIVVNEGENTTVNVRLSAAPAANVTVSIARLTGDKDLALASPTALTFSRASWSASHSFQISAEPDSDTSDGVALFRLSGPGVANVDIAVRERDRSPGAEALIVTDVAALMMREGTRGNVGVKLSRAPGRSVAVAAGIVGALRDVAAVSPGSLVFDDSNWAQTQFISVTAIDDDDGCDHYGDLVLATPGASSLAVAVAVSDAQRPASSGALLCGVLQTAVGTMFDSDVNDVKARYVANDTNAQAQDVLSPATIAGFVNAPGSGAPGRSTASGDVVDVYRVDLRAGDQITLHVASWQQADVDLLLYDETGALINASVTGTEMEQVSTPRDGRYFVHVRACSDPALCLRRGATNYVLVVGGGYHPQAEGVVELVREFPPDEMLAALPPALARSLATTTVSGWEMKQGTLETTALFRHRAAPMSRAVADKDTDSVVERKLATLMAVKSMRDRGARFAEPNFVVRPFFRPNDPLFRLQWHTELINAPQAWDLTVGSDQVIVAVADSGVLRQHPDLREKLLAGYDFVSNSASAGDGDGIDANPEDPGDKGPQGSTFHGTHVAGTVAAAGNNGIGVAGVGGNVRVMPLRVLGLSGGSVYDLAQAVRYAAQLSNDSGTTPARKADVLNLSLGSDSYSAALFDAITQARAAGVIVIAAAGNERGNAPVYPAAYDGVVSVSAVDFALARPAYANFGTTLDVMAPGGDIAADNNGDGVGDGVISTGGNDTSGVVQFRYPVFQGTSMAAPHVSGVVALMRAVYPGMTPEIFDALLASGRITRDLGAPGRDDDFGYGLIDAYKAVSEAMTLASGLPAPTLAPRLAVQPTALALDAVRAEATLLISNAGGGRMNIATVTADQPWLSVTAAAVDANGLGSYRVRTGGGTIPGAAPGPLRAVIRVVSDGGEFSVPVAYVATAGLAAFTSGAEYAVLYDAAEHRVLQTVPIRQANDRSSLYQFLDVRPGTYHVFSGTDLNENGQVCDPGELCGAYTSLAAPSEVMIDGADLAGVNFSVAAELAFRAATAVARSGALAGP